MKSRIPNNLFFGTKNDEWIIEGYNNYVQENKKKPLYNVALYKVAMIKRAQTMVMKKEQELELEFENRMI